MRISGLIVVALLALFGSLGFSAASYACGVDPCARVQIHRPIIGYTEKTVRVPIFGKPEVVNIRSDACNECRGSVHLVPNATVIGPCPKGWSITPVRGFDYVTPAAGVILHEGQRIHVNRNGTFNLVD